MKNLVVTGILGLAAVSAYFIFTSGDDAPQLIVPDAKPAAAPAELRAKITKIDRVRTVEADEAQIALEKIGLWEPSDTVSWDARNGKNGNYTFTNFSSTKNNDTAQVANLEISGLRLIDGDKVYYDAVSATKLSIDSENGESLVTMDAIGFKMPDSALVKDSLPDVSAENGMPLMDHLFDVIEPGKLPVLPEAFVENVRMVDKKEIRVFTPTGDVLIDIENGKMPEPEMKTVEEVTTLGFAALSKIDGTDDYALQASNFSSKTHNYRGSARQTGFVSVQISGFSNDVSEILNPEAHMFGKRGSNSFEPMAQSITLQGFETETDQDLVQIGQGSLWHSDTRSDQFTRKIDIPNILIESKPQYQSNEEKPQWSDNPFAEIGYDKVNISISSQTAYDKQARTITEDETRITASDAFDVSLSYKFGNVDPINMLFMGRMTGNGSKENEPVIENLNVSFSDRGIIDRVHEKLAEDRGMTLEEVKETSKAATHAMKLGAQTDYQRELMQSAIDAYSALIDTGGKIQLSVRPQRPINMNEFGKAFSGGRVDHYPDTEKTDEGSQVQDYEKSMKMDALDALIREMNISFEHYVAD